jgi:hypothetical protein
MRTHLSGIDSGILAVVLLSFSLSPQWDRASPRNIPSGDRL